MGKLSTRKRSYPKKVDRISGLSDHLLYHILAFLPTRSAMATSALSRRWEHVWPGIPVLNFTYKPLDVIDDFFSVAGQQQYRSLKHFLNRVLLHNRALCLERVDFDVHPIMRENDLQQWFKLLSRRSIKEVSLFYDRSDLPLTYLLGGTCGEHLVKLNIKCTTEESMVLTITPMLRFERLEIVNLTQVEITADGEPINSLARGSPYLRELVLFQCSGLDVNFRCSTLKILKLLECEFLNINIGVPNLDYFELILDEGENWNVFGSIDDMQFVIDDMPCLSKAKIYNCSLRATTWACVFHQVRYAIKLEVSLSRFIDEENENPTMDFNLPYFERLKCLEIRCCEEHSLLGTRSFLSHMPNCVSLKIQMPWSCNCDDLLKFSPANNSSLGVHVEYIEMYGIGKTRLASVELLRYLLACCNGLKEMKLHLNSRISSGWKKAMPKTIMNLPRPSTCEIIICDLT